MTSTLLTQRMTATNRKRTEGGIFAVISDDHNVHCLTESHLDTWWANLSPESKAAIYENDLEGGMQHDERPAPSPELSAKVAEIAASLETFTSKPWIAFADRRTNASL